MTILIWGRVKFIFLQNILLSSPHVSFSIPFLVLLGAEISCTGSRIYYHFQVSPRWGWEWLLGDRQGLSLFHNIGFTIISK